MNRKVFVIAFLGIISGTASGQVFRESIFGLDIPVQKWTKQTDGDHFNPVGISRLFIPEDVANLRFGANGDTTDIILVLDVGKCQIHWIRCFADPSRRFIQYIGTYEGTRFNNRDLNMPTGIAVASASEIFDPASDHFYVADKCNNRIVQFNFNFDPFSPSSDEIVWESAIYIDSIFSPVDIDYVDYGTGNRAANRLFALNDFGDRLTVFSHDGALLQSFDISDPADTTFYVFSGLTHKLNANGTVSLYLASIGDSAVRGYIYSPDGTLTFQRELILGERIGTQIAQVFYDDRFGLWAIESLGPHLFKLAPNLTRVIMEIGDEELDPASLNYLTRVCLLPERIVLIESMSDNTGILSFAFEPPSGKRDIREEEIIPYVFGLNQNYPNPFNPTTTVGFEIPSTQWVTLEIFNILGQKVTVLLDEKMAAGRYSLIWDGTNSAGRYVSSGVYFSKLSAGDNTEVKKMLMLK